MKRLFAIIIFIGLTTLAWGQVNQSTMLGQIQLAEQQRGQVDPASNVLLQHIANYQNSNGGPVLASLGIQLGNVVRNTYVALLMTVVMTLMVGAAWLKTLREGKGLGDQAATIAVKLIVGIAVFHMPSLVYGVGMTIRDLGTIVAKMAFTSTTAGPTLSTLSISGSPEEISLERVRAMAMDRAIQDLSQPMNGIGAQISFNLYDQMVARAVAVAPQPANGPAPTAASLGLQLINKNCTAIEKSRIINANISKLFQILESTDTSDTFVFQTYRVGPTGTPEMDIGADGGSFDERTSSGLTALTQNIDASQITITSGSINKWLVPAQTIRAAFEQQAAQGAFPTKQAYDSAYESTLDSYGNTVYVQTVGFIKKTFWEDLSFACGDAGGTTWSYISQYSASDKALLGISQKNLVNWYQNTTGRPVASFSPATPKDETFKKASKAIMDWLAFFRDRVVTGAAMTVFDLIIEVYVFVIWLTFPLWFYKGTEKAFTGALNVYLTACLVPAVFTFLFVLWDAVVGYFITLGAGS
jgi:hypothetical protein